MHLRLNRFATYDPPRIRFPDRTKVLVFSESGKGRTASSPLLTGLRRILTATQAIARGDRGMYRADFGDLESAGIFLIDYAGR